MTNWCALTNTIHTGGIGALTGASSSAASDFQPAGGGGGLKLYRRDNESKSATAPPETQPPSSAASSSLLSGASDRLWGFVQQQYDGDEIPPPVAAQQQPPPPPPPGGPLPAPPSQLLTGFISGIGGFLARGVERAAALVDGEAEGETEDLPLGEMLRRKAAREAEAAPGVRLYGREEEGGAEK